MAASLVVGWRVGSGRVVEDFAFVVIPLPADNSGVVPDLDGAVRHAKQPACELRRYAKVSPQAEVSPVIRGQRGEDDFGDRGHVGRVRVVGAPPRRD